MATKPLKTLTFEGLDDTYTVPQIDASLSTAGKAADAKATGDSLAEKAYASGMVDMAKSLAGGQYTPDKQPYHFRLSPSGGAKDEVIVGGSLGWNQLCPKHTGYNITAGDSTNVTVEVDADGYVSISGTPTQRTTIQIIPATPTIPANHVCLLWANKLISLKYGRNGFGSYEIRTGQLTKHNADFGCIPLIVLEANTTYSESRFKFMTTDLTTCFGSTIADYIYSLEQATAGAGVAWVKRYIDLDTYHEYDAGSIQSVEGLVSHDVVGFNQWDEEWEVGWINTGTGANQNANDAIRSKNYIPVIGGTSYHISTAYTANNQRPYLHWYDANKNWIWYGYSGAGDHSLTVALPNNAKYVRFSVANLSTPVTYNHDICINLSDPSRNGTYEPYEKHSYPLDSTITLRGVPKLVDGKLVAEGDWYEPSGEVARRFWRVILTGTESWALEGSLSDQDNNPTSRFYIAKNDILKPSGTMNTRNYIGHMISTVPTLKGGYVTQFNMTGIEMGVTGYQGDGSANYLYIIVNNAINTTITTVDALKLWLASHPLEIVYELATPTTETAQPFQSPMLVGQTEEYVSDSVVPVGHDSRYYEDITGKVNNLPSDFSTLIAPVEVTYTATRNYTVGSYLIVSNQLYKVTSAISTGGTITPNSNVTATTIMAEILALA